MNRFYMKARTLVLRTPIGKKMRYRMQLNSYKQENAENVVESAFGSDISQNEKEAIVCYQTILENFYDTAYGPKAKDILTQMGVEIKVPTAAEAEDDFDEEEI